jgi:N utilization substance protein B
MNEEPKNAEVSAEESADTMNYNYKRLGRELAMQFLFQCDLTGGECTDAMRDEFWAQAEESGEFPANRVFRKARNYAERLVAGVNENENELMDTISEFSHDWDADRIAPVDRSIMKIAIYEMKYSDGIPMLVSIDEAIEIAKKFGSEKSGNFINGILNSVKNNLIKKS